VNELTFVPRENKFLANFGKGDDRKLKAYLLMLAAFLEGKPENTKRTYRAAIRQFFDMFGWISPEDVSVAHAVAFKKKLSEKVGDATVYYRISALSSFFEFLKKPAGASETPLISSNPFDLVPRSDIKPTPYGKSTAMEWDTFQKIYDAIPSDPIGLRDKAILIFFAFTGRRRAEVAGLRIRDLNLKSNPRSYSCKVKGGSIKKWQLPDIAYDAIKAYWIAADRLVSLHPDAGVFTAAPTTGCSSADDSDAPLSPRAMNDIMHKAAKRAGVDPSTAHVHGLRHMAARDLDKAGARLQDIQEFLGHETPNTTAVYIQRLSGPASAHEDKLVGIRGDKLVVGIKTAR
jgi:integrase